VLSSDSGRPHPSRSVTRPVPREAVRIRCGRFPRIHSHMVAVPSTSPTSTGLVAQRITHTASAQGEEEHVEGLQMSAKEIERLLAEALDAFDDPTPLPPVAAGEVGRRSSVPICQLPQVTGHKSISAARSSSVMMSNGDQQYDQQYSRSVPSMAPVASMRQDTHRSGVSPGRMNWRLRSSHSLRLVTVAAHLVVPRPVSLRPSSLRVAIYLRCVCKPRRSSIGQQCEARTALVQQSSTQSRAWCSMQSSRWPWMWPRRLTLKPISRRTNRPWTRQYWLNLPPSSL